MTMNHYQYDYHDLAEDVEFIDVDQCEQAETAETIIKSWENYYHNIAEELIED